MRWLLLLELGDSFLTYRFDPQHAVHHYVRHVHLSQLFGFSRVAVSDYFRYVQLQFVPILDSLVF